MGNFRVLKVWQAGKKLAIDIYKITNDGGFKNDFRFKDQIRSAAVSIPSNIAEGDELGTNKHSVKFFYIAKGSAAEVITQLEIVQEIGYLKPDISKELINRCEHISHMLARLISSRSSKTIIPQYHNTKSPISLPPCTHFLNAP